MKFIKFGYDINEEWDAMSDEEKDINNKMTESSIYEDEEPHKRMVKLKMEQCYL